MSKVQPWTATAPSPQAEQSVQAAGLSIVWALVNGVQVPVACPADWCKREHSGDDATKHVEDIDHSSADVDLMAPNMIDGGNDLCLYAHLGQDLYSSDENMRASHVRLEDGGGESTYMSLDRALVFADRLVSFAEQIRGLVRTARGDNSEATA